MAITLKRQLTPEEKNIILQRHGRICFATGHAIPEEESLHYDHIKAFALGGQSELDNIAPMCEFHNKAKGMLPLEDFRIRLQLLEFFGTGDRLTLKNLLQFMKDQRPDNKLQRRVRSDLEQRPSHIGFGSWKIYL